MASKRFSLGKLHGTPGALAELTPGRIAEIVTRHLSGDWGLTGAFDSKLNDEATFTGARILSVYWIDEQDHSRGRVWLITDASYAEAEGDEETRHATTLLLPDEY